MRRRIFMTLGLSMALAATALPQQRPVRGAIFTTLSNGSAVNANQFDSKCSVYLDGGPGPNAPAGAAGLNDGDYYFQVTDPSGKQLLSTDIVLNRQFRVRNGVINQNLGLGHPTGIDQDHAELGAITIRLANDNCPTDFLDSPNNGGAYKVWATPVGDFSGDPRKVDNDCGSGCFHGFVPSKSKTDNFKAKAGTATFCLTVLKEFREPNETVFTPEPAWLFEVTDTLKVPNEYYTDSAGELRICGLTAGEYTVAEFPQFARSELVKLLVNGQVQQAVNYSYTFTWNTGQPAPVLLFSNERLDVSLPE